MKALKSPSDLTMLGDGILGFMMDARIHSAEKAWLISSERKTAPIAMHLVCQRWSAEVSMPDGIESRTMCTDRNSTARV